MSVENSTKQQMADGIDVTKLKIIITIRCLYWALLLASFVLNVAIGVFLTYMDVNQFISIFVPVVMHAAFYVMTVHFGETTVSRVRSIADLYEKKLELVSDPDSK
jgi:hypothetical protein